MLLFELAAILFLLMLNGLLAMSEIAVVTARSARLTRGAEQGDRRAAAAATLKEEPTEFLSAVQIGITLVGILAGAVGGASLSQHLAEPLSTVSWLAPYADKVAFVLTVGAITYLSLVIGELVPKRIALANPEGIARRIALPMQRLSVFAKPLVIVLSASTNAVTRLLGIRRHGEPQITEQDIRAMIAEGVRAGVVHETEEDILERVFYMGDRQVRAIMTPRPDLVWIEEDATAPEIRALVEGSAHSRVLVCHETIDNVRGIVRINDLLVQCLGGERIELGPLLRDPLFVPAAMPLLQLLQQFRSTGVHMAVALDEYGSVLGVATLNDILNDLVADVPGALAKRDSNIVRREDGSWLIDGTVPLEDVEDTVGQKLLPLDSSRGSRTLGGLVLERLGRVPTEGDVVELPRVRLEVMDMDGRRVDRVLVQLKPVKGTDPPERG